MAFVMGIRLSGAVAGAAILMAQGSAKARKEEFWKWVAGKFTFRSSDPAPAPKPRNSCDADEVGDAVDGGTPADIQEPTLVPGEVTENAVEGDPTAEPDRAVNGEWPADLEKPALIPVNVTEDAVEGDPTVEQFHPSSDSAVSVPVPGKLPSPSYADGDSAVNGDLTAEPLHRRAVKPIGEAPAVVVVDAVSLGAAGVRRTVDGVDDAVRAGETPVVGQPRQTDSDELPQDAPAPDPPPRIRGSFLAAVGNGVKRLVRAPLDWLDTAINGVGRDPKFWDKVRRILSRIGWVVGEHFIIEPLSRRFKVLNKIYKAVKNEFWGGCWR